MVIKLQKYKKDNISNLNQSVLELISTVSVLNQKVSQMEPNIEKLLESKLESVSNQINNLEKILSICVENTEKSVVGTCTTAQTTTAKVVTLSNFTLTQGAEFSVIMTQAQKFYIFTLKIIFIQILYILMLKMYLHGIQRMFGSKHLDLGVKLKFG